MKKIIFTLMFGLIANIAVAQYIISVQKTDGSKPTEFQASLLSQIVFYPACPGLPTVDYSGKTYNTIQIGSQCWIKENLDVGTFITDNVSQTNNSTIEKYCYNNQQDSCDVYGGYYMWDEAMQYVTTQGTQGICPEGWHVATQSEYNILSGAVGFDGNTLKDIWQGTGEGVGTNTSGFSALLAGYGFGGCNGCFLDFGNSCNIWTSTELGGSNAWGIKLNATHSGINSSGYLKIVTGNIRCIKD